MPAHCVCKSRNMDCVKRTGMRHNNDIPPIMHVGYWYLISHPTYAFNDSPTFFVFLFFINFNNVVDDMHETTLNHDHLMENVII